MPDKPADIALNRQLRRAATAAEQQLWALIRGRQLAGAKLRRQPHVCGWVVDFASFAHALVVELDGGIHSEPENAAHDARHDAHLAANGWRVLRFRNAQLTADPQAVLHAIETTLRERAAAATTLGLSKSS